jgi:hypothetical protein
MHGISVKIIQPNIILLPTLYKDSGAASILHVTNISYCIWNQCCMIPLSSRETHTEIVNGKPASLNAALREYTKQSRTVHKRRFSTLLVKRERGQKQFTLGNRYITKCCDEFWSCNNSLTYLCIRGIPSVHTAAVQCIL